MLAVTVPGVHPVWNGETCELICDGMPWDLGQCSHPPG